MQTADVVLYDRLVSDDILQLVHGGARMVYVGKQAGFHTRTQVCLYEIICAAHFFRARLLWHLLASLAVGLRQLAQQIAALHYSWST
jgi:siroheme synthase